MIAKGFPCIAIHAGECGLVASIDFTITDMNNAEKWAEIAENLRRHILLMEDEYKKRFSKTDSIFRFKENK